MALTETPHVGDNSETLFPFYFKYIKESDVKVSLDGVDQATTEYSFASATQILFNTAPGNGVAIRIYRDTNIDDLKAEFFPGSAIRASDLNDNFLQNNYKVQELANNTWDFETQTIHSDETWVSSDTQIATTAAMDARFQDIDLDTIKSTETWVENDDTVPTTLAAAVQFDTLVQTGTPSTSGYPVGKTWLQNDADKTVSIFDGTNWLGVASGGTFTNQPKVIYVDATAGSDSNTGHRISQPKATIKAAIADINADATYGDGSVVVVAPGIYQEVAPIQIQKKDVSIVGTALRSCIIHPTTATQYNSLFEVNSGSYLANLTFTGVKAGSGTGNTLDPVLPVQQGWNVSFYAGATITKSPYIQNCTNFSDSEIDNDNLNAHTPAGGSGGDIDSAPTGGGLLVDGSVVDSNSPLRSIVCDSYTHVGLNGPGILVTNNGYLQATSSYAFFNKYHIKALNGGQANLAASTTDFGELALVADGKSTTNIITSTVVGNFLSGVDTFTIDTPVADASWHGTATRPQSNMLVVVNGVTYPILSAAANGTGWDVEIYRPDPTNRNNNLGLNGNISNGDTVQFYLRSQIASSGHTMEYVGAGTDYRALPENGGIPIEANQVTESNNGKIWTATTDHNGKFKVGDFFEVDQQLGYVTIPEGSIAFDVLSDTTPQLGGDLDVNGQSIVSTSNGDINITPNGTGAILLNTTTAVDGALGVSGDTLLGGQIFLENGTATDPTLAWGGTNQDTGIYSPGEDQLAITTNGTARLSIDSTGLISANSNRISSVADPSLAQDAATKNYIDTNFVDQTASNGAANIPSGADGDRPGTPAAGQFRFNTTSTEFEGYDGTAWGNIGGGTAYPEMGVSGTNRWAVVHSYTVDDDYSIPSGSHVINAGPMVINSGVTVTVPTGSNWVIV